MLSLARVNSSPSQAEMLFLSSSVYKEFVRIGGSILKPGFWGKKKKGIKREEPSDFFCHLTNASYVNG